VLLLLGACQGPPAPDAAVCQDFIHRICLPPVCLNAAEALNVGTSGPDCEQTLQDRTGCGADDFAFTGLSRERFLSCRLPLLNAGSSSDSVPDCSDVQDILNLCPDVVLFMNGGGQ
jgi:hypothetical protein